jgi:hypothetical protein
MRENSGALSGDGRWWYGICTEDTQDSHDDDNG